MSMPRLALDAPATELSLIDDAAIERAIEGSRTSPRGRIILPFHKRATDGVHRMLNAIQPHSYIRPHRHLSPPKAEAWIVLRGELAFFVFEDDGRIRSSLHLREDGPRRGVDLEPGAYHGMVALVPDTVIYEVKNGPYDPADDKSFGPFAPVEGSREAEDYRRALLEHHRATAASALAAVAWRPPVLRTARLLLRGYEPSDAEAIFAYASDEETTRYMAWDRLQQLDDARAFLGGLVADSYRVQRLDYALCLASDPARVIGGLGLYDRGAGVSELGFILARPHWGQGLVVEGLRALLDHALATTDVVRIAAPILADNTRSRRVAEKLGLRLEATLRQARDLRGRRWDEVIYARLRDDR